MPTDYLLDATRSRQTERDRADQVENSAGGYAWKVDKWERLNRFLILGTEGGSYYASQRDLTREGIDCLRECTATDPKGVVNVLAKISHAGRAPKNDQAIFALAYVASHGDEVGRAYALDHLTTVCRTGTHLFQFVKFVDSMRGWGRGLRSAVAHWYLSKTPGDLAYQLVKYRQREGWTHRDVLRKCHAKSSDPAMNDLLKWVVADGDRSKYPEGDEPVPDVVLGYEYAREELVDVPSMIRRYNLPREALPTESLGSPRTWEALLEKMPYTAMVRNLGNMAKCGLMVPGSSAALEVLGRLADKDRIAKSRVHPIQLLAASLTYGNGRGARGSGEWVVTPQIVDALDQAFELSFGNIEASGKRVHLGLDISGSMGMGTVAGVPGLTPRVAAAAMALITARTEPGYSLGVFTTQYQQVDITAGSRLRDVVNETARMPMGGTDCALPMRFAQQHKLEVDTFVIYTDSETWAGDIHPHQALASYRTYMSIDAKLVVVGMVSNGFTIADPDDPGMLDVVGFDTATPQVISEFSRGL